MLTLTEMMLDFTLNAESRLLLEMLQCSVSKGKTIQKYFSLIYLALDS